MHKRYVLLVVVLALAGCTRASRSSHPSSSSADSSRTRPTTLKVSPEVRRVIDSAKRQTQVTTSYDPSYIQISYPGGDVPSETGVCTDVVIRAFRASGVDLQQKVHEDMVKEFSAYPRKWGASTTDTNIDHRRVPNLMVYFERSGKSIAISNNDKDYIPGDVVAWDLGGGITHIGLVSDEVDIETGRHWIVHNIGGGAQFADVLFSWKVIGHYRYFNS